MTGLEKRNVKRRVYTAQRTPLVVVLAPEGIWLREPKRRTAYLLGYGSAFMTAVRQHVDSEKRRKAAEKKARRAAR